IFGLPGLLSSRSFQGGKELLTVYGPSGIKNYIETSLQASGTHLTYPLAIKEIEEGQLFDDPLFTVYCKKLEHGIPSYGYRIVEKEKPGELLVEKLKSTGIQPGPIYQQIKENNDVTTAAGRRRYRQQVNGRNKKGRMLLILGDTRYPEQTIAFVKDSDVLVHEAPFEHAKERLAGQYFHPKTTQAPLLAEAAESTKLVL